MKQEYHNPPAAQVKTWSPDARSPEHRRYAAELEARARFYEGTDAAESEAWQAAADDLGDFEHWRWIKQRRRRRPSRAERPVEVQRLLNRTHALNAGSGVTAV
jgi:hypothetical protein